MMPLSHHLRLFLEAMYALLADFDDYNVFFFSTSLAFPTFPLLLMGCLSMYRTSMLADTL